MNLKFEDLPINHSFVSWSELYVKVSKAFAVSVTLSEKIRFKKSDSVSIISILDFDSFEAGGARHKWKGPAVKKYVAHLKKETELKRSGAICD